MSVTLKNKVALVVGGSSGIGRAAGCRTAAGKAKGLGGEATSPGRRDRARRARSRLAPSPAISSPFAGGHGKVRFIRAGSAPGRPRSSWSGKRKYSRRTHSRMLKPKE